MCNDPNCPTCKLAAALAKGDAKTAGELLKAGPLGQLIGDATIKSVKLIGPALILTPIQTALKELMEEQLDEPCDCPQCKADIAALLKAGGEEVKLDAREACMPQVDALMAANWIFELPAIQDPEPWQWYWRRPSKVKGKKGRKFLSTNQAYNALMKEKA